jgi:ABC-2 type transport system ATP-binding protein
MTIPLLTLTHVERSFSKKVVLSGLSLTIYEGEVTAIVGHNGSGKSTLLKILSGLGTIDAGNRQERQGSDSLAIGFVPDRFPKLRFTACEYLRSVGKIRGIPSPMLEERIRQLHLTLRLDPSERGHLRHYSKGMLQKVNLMQALLQLPDILLMDEPLSGLDIQTQEELIDLLLQLNEQGLTIVTTTHEKEVVERLADRVILLKDGAIESEIQPHYKKADYRAITFLHNNPDEIMVYLQMEEVLMWKKEGHKWIVKIAAEHSDSYLQTLLKAEASIDSMVKARKDQ